MRGGAWTGHTGKRIRNVISIGIGGSDLGPVMAYEALRHYSQREMSFRFVSNVDGTDFAEATRDLDAAETLFIICSKTFTTLETLTNAHAARDWCLRGLGGVELRRAELSRSTSSRCPPMPRGSPSSASIPTNMFGFWDWVGGRYSMDSAIGLSTMLAIGADHFRAMLAGFHAMDEHFRAAPLESNLPVLMGLLAIWNNNFLGAATVAVLPYEQYLKRFPAYLQQLTMESNGKHVTLDGARVDYETGPDLLGRARHQRPAFVLPADPPGHAADPVRLHRLLPGAEPAADARRRSARPADGQPRSRRARRWRSARPPMRCGPKARPRRWCRIARSKATGPAPRSWPNGSTPHTLGALVALYEHSVFMQGVIWNIDSFDQWGVELGKELAKSTVAEIDRARTSRSSTTTAPPTP